jgi:hypothetical protein
VQCVLERGSDGSWQGPGVAEWVQLIGDGTTEVNLGTMTLIPMDRSPEMEDLSPVVFPLGYLMPIAGTETYNLMVYDMRIVLDAFTIPGFPEEGAKVNCFIQEAVFGNSIQVTSVAVYFNGVWYVDDDPNVIYP